MMFRRRNKKGSTTSDSNIDSSNHSIKNINNNSKHNTKYNLSQSLPELRRSVSLASTTLQKPIRGILRITSVEDSLHSVYGKDTGVQSSTSRRNNSCPPDFDLSVRSSQSDDLIIRQNGTAVMARRCSRQSVLFKAIEIREYERTVGDNPSCSSGPPVSISWDYYPQVKKLPLDDYENYRPNRRSSYEMILSREIRDSMLRKEWDVSRAEIAAAIRDTIKVKNQRRQTVQNLNKDKVEEMLEGASKKIFRSLMFKSSTTQELDMLNRQYNAVQELRQQEMKLAKEQQQQYGNDDTINTSLGGRDVGDSLIVVGMSIDDEDEIVEDLDDDDDDGTEHKEDLPNAGSSKANKKPILIEEDDNDAALLMNVRSVKNHTYTATAMVDTGITPLPDRTTAEGEQQQQQQYKGENSSEDGSTNNSNNSNMNQSSHHHHTVKNNHNNNNNNSLPNHHNHHTTTTTTNSRTMEETNNTMSTTTEI